MPINAYTGLMGSGKSFECVQSVIIPAINQGRRVVTNVDGIDSDGVRAYCYEKFGTPLHELGHVVHCKNDDIGLSNFLPYGQESETLCLPGDIICIDEAWRFWGPDCKLLPEHKIFFREHRHFVHPESKVCCDLVLMVQDISDLHRILKVVVELSFRTTKIKSLGLSKVYRVEMWEGYKQTVKGRVAVNNKKYDAAIFSLYSSYTGGAGKELQVDSRQNILKSKTLIAMIIGLAALGISAAYLVYRFFNPADLAAPHSQSGQGELHEPSTQAGVVGAARFAGRDTDHEWRIAGMMDAAGSTYIVLAAASGVLRLEHPSNFQNSGMLMVGDVDGQTVTAWGNVPEPVAPSSGGEK